MGLDMYLTKRIYIGADYGRVTGKIELERDGRPIPINVGKVNSITESVAYWRKANAIHAWFVDNVQDGEDNCREYYVSRKDLENLYEACNETLKYLDSCDTTVDKGYTIYIVQEEFIELPTTTGFFFGSDEYNVYYRQQLEYTMDILGGIINESDDGLYSGDYYYQSSW